MPDEPPQLSAPDLSFLLAHASHVLATRMTAALAEIGMTPRGHCVLVKALPGDLTQIELAKLADLDKTTMVVTLDDLETAGYAVRLTSPRDRRARIVQVTDEGRRMVAAGQRIVDAVHSQLLEALPAKQRTVFAAALAALVSGFLAEPSQSARPVRRMRQPVN